MILFEFVSKTISNYLCQLNSQTQELIISVGLMEAAVVTSVLNLF